ncbi:MAG: signal peptidase I, partial [Blastocatellia bacterium]
MTKRVKILLVVAVVTVVAFLALGVFSFLSFRVVTVPTGSMANTVIPGESLLCSRNVSEVRRGDIVLFKWPSDPNVIFLNRVIGLPGERIQVRGMKVFINDQELPEAMTIVELGDGVKDSAFRELSVERGDGPYRVYYSKRSQQEAEDSDFASPMKYGVIEEFQIPPSQYFVLG